MNDRQNPVEWLGHLFEAANGDESFVRDMLRFFIARTPGLVAELTEAYNNRQCDRARKLAHRLKASVDLAGSPEMRRRLAAVFRSSRMEKDCCNNRKLTVELSEATGLTIRALKRFLKQNA